MSNALPSLRDSTQLSPDQRRLFIGAYGFEDRSLGWVLRQSSARAAVSNAIVFKYKHPKGKNKIDELRAALTQIGVRKRRDINCDVRYPYPVEDVLDAELSDLDYDEIILDVSAMTKLLILVCLCKLSSYRGAVRLVYSEAKTYSPSKREFERAVKKGMAVLSKFPSRGAESVVRLRCLSSIRMQGQPVILIAFTSFNEQLVRHMLGTMSPHRLIFINGRPPRAAYGWREHATQTIHAKLIEEFAADNPKTNSLLKRVSSTLDYRETVHCVDGVYREYGDVERVICAATGSKMQTVGLFFAKRMHPDIHVEYPTPDSYFVQGFSKGVRSVYELSLPNFAEAIVALSKPNAVCE